jgi:alkaline phosphatase D
MDNTTRPHRRTLLRAGAFGPNALDPTFGPEAVFVHAPPAQNT